MIGSDMYISKTSNLSNEDINKVNNIAKELEIAKASGKYSRKAASIASEAPTEAYRIVEQFVKDKERKLYGGTAINMYLPRKHKIYPRESYPDYDFYSTEPWNDAMALADLLYSAGFQYTETKEGIHKGTFKVFANFWPVADITYLPQELYDQITTVKKNGFTIVSPEYLQLTMYDIISKPLEDPVRWAKVAYRQQLLSKWAPVKFKTLQCNDFINEHEQVELDPDLSKALEITQQFAHKEKIVHGGALAYNKYVTLAGGMLRLPAYYYQFYDEKAADKAVRLKKTIEKEIHKTLETDVIYQPYKDINKTTFILYIRIEEEHRVPIFLMTQLSHCIPYKNIGGRYYCAIDYLYYELYNQMFDEDSNIGSHNISCLIRYLHYVQYQYYSKNNISQVDISPLQRFVKSCRGPYSEVIREEFYSRWLDKAKMMENIHDIRPAGDSVTINGVTDRRIRVYPKDSQYDASENDCTYPHTWLKEEERCVDIPVTGYQPGKPKTIRTSTSGVINI